MHIFLYDSIVRSNLLHCSSQFTIAEPDRKQYIFPEWNDIQGSK